MHAWLVSLPDPTIAAVISVVIALLGVLIRLIALKVPWLGDFLNTYKEEWGTALGILLVNVLQTYLPGGEWAGVSVLGVELIVAVVTVLLAKYGFRKAGARNLQ